MFFLYICIYIYIYRNIYIYIYMFDKHITHHPRLSVLKLTPTKAHLRWHTYTILYYTILYYTILN